MVQWKLPEDDLKLLQDDRMLFDDDSLWFRLQEHWWVLLYAVIMFQMMLVSLSRTHEEDDLVLEEDLHQHQQAPAPTMGYAVGLGLYMLPFVACYVYHNRPFSPSHFRNSPRRHQRMVYGN